MLQESPKLKGLKKTKAGRKQTSKKLPYAKSRTKRNVKGEPQVSPLTYPQNFGYMY